MNKEINQNFPVKKIIKKKDSTVLSQSRSSQYVAHMKLISGVPDQRSNRCCVNTLFCSSAEAAPALVHQFWRTNKQLPCTSPTASRAKADIHVDKYVFKT